MDIRRLDVMVAFLKILGVGGSQKTPGKENPVCKLKKRSLQAGVKPVILKLGTGLISEREVYLKWSFLR